MSEIGCTYAQHIILAFHLVRSVLLRKYNNLGRPLVVLRSISQQKFVLKRCLPKSERNIAVQLEAFCIRGVDKVCDSISLLLRFAQTLGRFQKDPPWSIRRS